MASGLAPERIAGYAQHLRVCVGVFAAIEQTYLVVKLEAVRV